MDEHGIWSDMAGGFIETGFYGDEGRARAQEHIDAACKGFGGELDPDEANACEVLAICSEHEEQPAGACGECDVDEDAADDDDEED